MAKTRIPVAGTIGKSLRTTDKTGTTEATISQAQFQALVNAVVAVVQQQNPSGLTPTDWKIISSIPPNVTSVAALNANGQPVRNPDGSWSIVPLATSSPPGEEGPPGEPGPPGRDGPQGPVGPTGPSGGPIGPAGPAIWMQADAGEDGDPIPGPMGPQGPQGPTGPAGTGGSSGAHLLIDDSQQGEMGPPGPPGPQGPQGATGSSGTGGGAVGMHLLLDDTEPGEMGPPGPPGASGSGTSTANLTPDTHPTVPNAADDEFEAGSSVDLTKWTWVSQSTASTSVAQGALTFNGSASVGINVSMLVQTIVGGTWAYTAKILRRGFVNGAHCGAFAIRNSGSGKLVLFGYADSGLAIQRFTNPTTFSASGTVNSVVFPSVALNSSPTETDYWYFQLASNGTNVTLSISRTGVPGTFNLMGTEPLATFITSADQIALAIDNNSATQGQLICDWFRKTA